MISANTAMKFNPNDVAQIFTMLEAVGTASNEIGVAGFATSPVQINLGEEETTMFPIHFLPEMKNWGVKLVFVQNAGQVCFCTKTENGNKMVSAKALVNFIDINVKKHFGEEFAKLHNTPLILEVIDTLEDIMKEAAHKLSS